jgi:peroxiredoxin
VDIVSAFQKVSTGTDQPHNTGEHASLIVGKRLDGSPISIDPRDSGRPTVLYVFTPQCVWCTKNLAGLKALEAEAKGGRIRLIGLALDRKNLAEYVNANGLEFPIVMEPTIQTSRDYSLGATPMTFLVGSGGLVEAVWQGAYSQATCDDIEKHLGLRLPAVVG